MKASRTSTATRAAAVAPAVAAVAPVAKAPTGMDGLRRALGNRATRALLHPPITVGTAPVDVPYRREMEHAFGASFGQVTAYVGEQRALAPLGARAAAWSGAIAFASPEPERDVVAHELAHIEQLRRPGAAAASGVTHADDAAEREADQIAAAVHAAARAVRATARPGGAISFAPPAPPRKRSRVDELIDQIKASLPALDSQVLNEVGRLDLESTVAAALAELEASHAVLTKPQLAIVARARQLVPNLSPAPADPMVPPPSGELLPPPLSQRLARLSPAARQTVDHLGNKASGARLMADAPVGNPADLSRWALELQSLPHSGQANYLRAWYFRVGSWDKAKAKAVGQQIANLGIDFGPAAGAFTSLEHLDPNEPLPAPAADVASTPMSRSVDLYSSVHYDLSYRYVPGRLSTILQLSYPDGARLDLDLFLISDNKEPAPFQAFTRSYLGPAGRLFPLRLDRDTTPRLWAAKQAALRVMEDSNLDFENFVSIGLAGVMSNLPIGPVVTPEPTVAPRAPTTRRPTTTSEPPTVATTPPPVKTEPPPVKVEPPVKAEPPPVKVEPPVKAAPPPAKAAPSPAPADPATAPTPATPEPPRASPQERLEAMRRARAAERDRAEAQRVANQTPEQELARSEYVSDSTHLSKSEGTRFGVDPPTVDAARAEYQSTYKQKYLEARRAGLSRDDAAVQAKRAATARIDDIVVPKATADAPRRARADALADTQRRGVPDAFSADDAIQQQNFRDVAPNAKGHSARGGVARDLSPQLVGKTPAEMEALAQARGGARSPRTGVDQVRTNQVNADGTPKLNPDGTPASYPQIEYNFPDGTRLRIKPAGDKINSSDLMYSVELVHPDAPRPGPPQESVAFKYDAQGRPVPKGPSDIRNPYPPDTAPYHAYQDALIQAGHLRGRPTAPPSPTPSPPPAPPSKN